MKRLVYGVGFNDADYVIKPTIRGKQVICPFYTKWASMIQRCYSTKLHERHPNYIGCSVIKEWLTFMNFRNWMIKQDWKGKELDKDILNIGNKLYSPETCVFISRQINSLLGDHAAKRGDYPQGVSFNKKNGKYKAQLSYNNKQKHLGYFTNPEFAHIKYCKAKYNHILEIASKQSDPKIKVGLLNHANLLVEV